jgi:small subunit ribosomal protein S1
VEGLVHTSEMDWTNKNVHPSKLLTIAEEVEVMILDIDEERRRISLGIKQCRENPWESFSANFKKGDRVSGAIKSITDFGIFIGLDGGIDGLVHLSDISWNEKGEEAIRNFKKGDMVEAIVLSIEPDRERVSLGIKQMDQDPFSDFVASHPKGSIVTGTVREVEAKGATVTLSDDVDGYIRASEIAQDRVEDARTHLKEGDSIEAAVMGVDRKTRSISLSVKNKDNLEEAAAVRQYSKAADEAAEPATLGDLIREQMEARDE